MERWASGRGSRSKLRQARAHLLLPLAQRRMLKGMREVKFSGIRMRVDLARYIDAAIWAYRDHYEYFEQRFIGVALKPGGVAVDVGAHEGLHSLLMARSVGETGQVMSFEPGFIQHHHLIANIELNRFRCIRPFKVALSSYEGQADLHHDWFSDGGSSLLPPGKPAGTSEPVEVTTLDRVWREFGTQQPTRLDLIKVDIEGAEWEFIKGASQTIARFRPAVMMEIYPAGLARFGATERQVREYFYALDYAVEDVITGEQLTRGKDVNHITNYIMIPRERATS
jgi:FkbM family methyltransferase